MLGDARAGSPGTTRIRARSIASSRSRLRAGAAIPVRDLPVPRGWFAVATSAELRPGAVVRAPVGGEEFVVWRTAGGTLSAASAWCPHLGANLGCVGRVTGEQLECGFHGFRYRPDGSCEMTGYGGRVPPKAALRTVPVRETGGIVLLWFDPAGGVPDFEPPELPLEGWTAPRFRASTFAGHPLETTENSVDVGHFAFLHGYDDVAEIEQGVVDGATLHARYGMTRSGRATGIRLPTLRTEFDVYVHGLGLSVVELTVLTLGWRGRLYVLPTPIGDGMLTLRLGVTTHVEPLPTVPPWLRRIPAPLVARLFRDATLVGLYFDVVQDRRVWTTKRHVPHPVLADGDGPIALYRKWAQQFLGPGSPAAAVPVDSALNPR